MAASDVGVEREVHVAVEGVTLVGDLACPARPQGVILFAHGSGSSRHSPRNRKVAQALRASGLATLLIDLLTAREEAEDAATGHLRFEVDDVVCFATPEPFMAVGRFYDDFSQTTDEEVRALLASAQEGEEAARARAGGSHG